jgi:hypothetical protein
LAKDTKLVEYPLNDWRPTCIRIGAIGWHRRMVPYAEHMLTGVDHGRGARWVLPLVALGTLGAMEQTKDGLWRAFDGHESVDAETTQARERVLATQGHPLGHLAGKVVALPTQREIDAANQKFEKILKKQKP